MGTTSGAFSKLGSTAFRPLVLLVATICIAAIAPGLARADAKGSPHGKQKKDGTSTGPAKESPGGDSPSDGTAADTTGTGSGGGQPVNALQCPAAKVEHGVATFRLRGIAPERIRSGYVKHGRKIRRLRLSRIRAAARRGVLRFNMKSLRASHRSLRTTTFRRRKSKTTLVVVTDPPPAPAPAPAPTPSPTPTPTPTPVVGWSAVGSPPLADAAAAALVTPRAETRPENVGPNHYVPSAAEVSAFRSGGTSNPLRQYVTGGFAGTTDEILQWGAHKWGIPEDVLRAVAVTESYWRQSAMGDRRDGVNASLYPALSRIDADSVYESLGLMQVKWRPDGSVGPGTEPLRWKSTAFNVDYWGSSVRYYYDGLCNWCGSGYGAGQAWASVGAWFSPSPWWSSGAQNYASTVQNHIAARTWEKSGF